MVRDLIKSTSAQAKLEAEFQTLKEDRETLRNIFPTGNSKVMITSPLCDEGVFHSFTSLGRFASKY